ncbi:Pol polyprotein [Elysia marginata]|uniref:Pol polyprotein n=1 Tax=Elysia marginata TaxID=1093978 RepID=A0AAV4J341_9GAST|nr:Pol polyprotein [Elysia marginata]
MSIIKSSKTLCAPPNIYPAEKEIFDIVGPLPESCGHRYLITIIDRNNRWPEATLSQILQLQNVPKLWWVVGSLGLAFRGTYHRIAVNSLPLRCGLKSLNALEWSQGTPNNSISPQAKGMVERFHRTLKAALKARLTGNNWVKELPWVLLELRAAPKEDLGYLSAGLVYGEPLTVPGEFTPSQALPWSATEFLTAFRAKKQLLKPRPTVHHSKPQTYLPPSLFTAKYVYIRTDTVKTPLQKPYSGPYMVLAPDEKTFLVDMGGRAERISIGNFSERGAQLKFACRSCVSSPFLPVG